MDSILFGPKWIHSDLSRYIWVISTHRVPGICCVAFSGHTHDDNVCEKPEPGLRLIFYHNWSKKRCVAPGTQPIFVSSNTWEKLQGQPTQQLRCSPEVGLRHHLVRSKNYLDLLWSHAHVGPLPHLPPHHTHSALKPLTCRIRICFTMVLFPDSPAPDWDIEKDISVTCGHVKTGIQSIT